MIMDNKDINVRKIVMYRDVYNLKPW